MNKKSLVVSDNNGTNFTVSGTEDLIHQFLNWVEEYKRGNYNKEQNVVVCNTPLDMKACTMKASRMTLRPSQFTTKKIAKA